MEADAPVTHRGCFVCGNALVSDGHVRDCVARLKRQRRGFQFMAREMFKMIDSGFWMSAMEDGKYNRASGQAECQVCQQEFLEHPQLPDLPTFHMLCNGEIVKT